jgi:hypothetical protein
MLIDEFSHYGSNINDDCILVIMEYWRKGMGWKGRREGKKKLRWRGRGKEKGEKRREKKKVLKQELIRWMKQNCK